MTDSDDSSTPSLSLRFQQTASPAPSEFQLHFSGYDDTRCPADVACGVAGEAQAFFWLTGATIKSQALVLHWSGAEPNRHNAVRIGGREFQLLSLEPRPSLKHPNTPGDYKAVVAVRSLPAHKTR